MATVCVNCEQVSRQDDARVLLAAAEIKEMLKTVETQRQQFAALHGDQLLPDGSIPITFTKVLKVRLKVNLTLENIIV